MLMLAVGRSAAAGSFLGDFGSKLISKIQHPDTRSWLTLPNQVYVARVWVPDAQDSVKLETIGDKGEVLGSTTVKVAKSGPTVVYAVSYGNHLKAYGNEFSWVR
jgi:hypothetical protein